MSRSNSRSKFSKLVELRSPASGKVEARHTNFFDPRPPPIVIHYLALYFHEGTHCLVPPVPPMESNLRVVSWDGEPIPIGEVRRLIHEFSCIMLLKCFKTGLPDLFIYFFTGASPPLTVRGEQSGRSTGGYNVRLEIIHTWAGAG